MINKIKILFLAVCSLVFLNSYVFGLSISPPKAASQSLLQEDSTIESENLVNSFNMFSGNEDIRMLFPNHPLNETHYFSSGEETHVLTLSYLDDTVYILSIDKKNEDDCDFDDEDDCDLEDEDDVADDLIISGYQAKHMRTTLDGVASEEFLYGWAGKAFADQLINKGTTLELHVFGLESTDHIILLVVCGPDDQTLEAKALKYAKSLEIESY